MKYIIYCRKSSEEEDRQVLSLEAQQRELEARARGLNGAEIVDVIVEARSAATPGRPGFDGMLQRLELGEADAIMAWHPDRLARNALDGGRIIHLLDRGVVRDLQFATASFENSPQGKFMLTILFGYSKYYVDALGASVRRGNRAKVLRGWLPNMPPTGYLNDPGGTIVPDPDRFVLVRRMWDLMLSGTYRSREVWRIATTEWRFRTKQRGRTGGLPLAPSALYKILRNPFYAGQISWEGQLHAGSHLPMVSRAEFDRVQELLGKPRPRPQYSFPYRGLIRCGECGFAVVAERKVNRFGSSYTYYHCSWRRRDLRCRQRSVRIEDLEEQLEQELGRLPHAGVASHGPIARFRESALTWFRRGDANSRSLILAAIAEQAILVDRRLTITIRPKLVSSTSIEDVTSCHPDIRAALARCDDDKFRAPAQGFVSLAGTVSDNSNPDMRKPHRATSMGLFG